MYMYTVAKMIVMVGKMITQKFPRRVNYGIFLQRLKLEDGAKLLVYHHFRGSLNFIIWHSQTYFHGGRLHKSRMIMWK